MEVHFPPELERKLSALAAQRGQGADELVQNLVAGCVDELAKPDAPGKQLHPLQTAADIILDRMRNVPPEIMSRSEAKTTCWPLKSIAGWIAPIPPVVAVSCT